MPLKLVTSKALVDGTGRPPIRNGVMLLKDGVIEKTGSPEEIGELVAALAGPAGSYMVGEVLSVNGGYHIA